MVGMSPRRAGAVAALAALLVAAGCLGRGNSPPCATALHDPPTGPEYPTADGLIVDGLAAALAADGGHPPAYLPDPRPARPLNVLALSGGGKYTAYDAGFLVGWTAAGTRPEFDVVTGISSGSLAAVFAFLGPAYDARLTALFPHMERADLFRFHPVRNILVHKTLATAEPLRDLICREVDGRAMDALRQGYACGRRLFVATGCIDAQRHVIWDVTAVAASGRPDAAELVHKILLAACSIPGWTPPVEFDVVVNGRRYRERHTDAGTFTEGFVQTAGPLPPGSTVYVLTAGKLYPDPLPPDAGFLATVYSNVGTTLSALYRADILRIYVLCQASRSRFCLAAMPQDFPVKASSLKFDPEEEGRLYRFGYQSAACGFEWRTTPPGVAPDERPPVRTGTLAQ